MPKKRIALHRGRTNKGGSAYSVRHNDRDFKQPAESHIDKRREHNNVYYTFDGYKTETGSQTFEESEKKFYKRFEPHLQAQNEKYKKRSQYDRVRTIDDYRRNPKTCPEEYLFYIGNKDNEIDPETFEKVLKDFIQWHEKEFPSIHILNYAIHRDEQGAQHAHVRQVYTAHDKKTGDLIVSQTQCLEQLGFQNKKQRFDNAKKLYTEKCRSKILEIAQQHGIELDTSKKRLNGLNREEFLQVKQFSDTVKQFIDEMGLIEKFAEWRFQHDHRYIKQSRTDLDEHFEQNESEIERE